MRAEVRAAIHVVLFCGVVLGALPVLLSKVFGESAWLAADRSWRSTLGLQLAAVLGLGAVQEFAARGRGTPCPSDPPLRLVVSGPYAYVANPMQLCKVLCIFFGAVFLGNAWFGLAGLVYLVFTAVWTAPREDRALERRFGAAFRAYRASVPRWWPRWIPHVAAPARLYVAAGCGPCRGVGRFVRDLGPAGLEVVAAEAHPSRALSRITYASEAIEEEGVAALARALEHVNLLWALLGFTLRLPGIAWLAELVADAMGGDRIGPCPVSTSARHTSS